MNIKKQISRLYLYEIVSGLQIVDAVWVFFLLERGFSLAQVGIAEGVFHAVSMCFEIPSGMVSDTIGRRKTLMLAGIVSAVSAFCMIVSDAFFMILLAMGINAVSYNLVSGTREALTYDSLLEAGEEKNYLKVASRQDFLYEGLFAFTNLMSIVTVAIGYQKAYFLSILQGILCTVCTASLQEAMEGQRTFGERRIAADLFREVGAHFLQTAVFLRKVPEIAWRMAYSGLISAAVYVVYMLLQDHLVETGLEPGFLGIPLLLISLCSMAGAVLTEKTGRMSLRFFYLAGGILTGIFLFLSGRKSLAVSVAGAGAAHCIGEMIMLRTEAENQKDFSGSSRATMVSVGSMAYSIFMVLLSPAAGVAAEKFSILAAFSMLGLLTAAAGLIMFVRRAATTQSLPHEE